MSQTEQAYPPIPIWIVVFTPADDVSSRLSLSLLRPFRIIETTLDQYRRIWDEQIELFYRAGMRIEVRLVIRPDANLAALFPQKDPDYDTDDAD